MNRVGVHTWNVAGKPPPDDLDLEDWIDVSDPADIYVFGYVFKTLPISINFITTSFDLPLLKVKQKLRADICVMIPK